MKLSSNSGPSGTLTSKFAFKPEYDDELDIVAAEVTVQVLSTVDENWVMVMNPFTNKMGIVPLNIFK